MRRVWPRPNGFAQIGDRLVGILPGEVDEPAAIECFRRICVQLDRSAKIPQRLLRIALVIVE